MRNLKVNLKDDLNLTNNLDQISQTVICQLAQHIYHLVTTCPNNRSSILDHVYYTDPTVIRNLRSLSPFFGDHLMVEFSINGPKPNKQVVKRRDWRRYSRGLLNEKLSTIDWDIDFGDVQSQWNYIESKLIILYH